MNMFPLLQRTGAYQFKYRIYTDEYADGCTQVDATGTRVSTRGDDFRSSLQVRSLGPCFVLPICTLDGAVSLLSFGSLLLCPTFAAVARLRQFFRAVFLLFACLVPHAVSCSSLFCTSS
jgi:hypothetical protein